MWHVNLYNVLFTVNNVVLIIIGIPFILQFVYMFLCWLPKKKYPKSEKKNKICVLIPAHNEEELSKRKKVKNLIASLKKEDPQVESNIFKSVENVNLSTVIAYKDKSGIKHNFLDDYKEKKDD